MTAARNPGSGASTTPPVTIYFIRHGLTPWTGTRLPGRLPGLSLSDEGCRQAENLVDLLSDVTFDAIYSSPLDRALETAAPLAAALDLSVSVLPGLNELDVGSWAGRTIKSLARTRHWRVIHDRPSGARLPGGESFIEMQARVAEVIETLVESHRGSRVACFSHADPIKAALALLLGMPLDSFQRIEVSPGSASVARVSESRADVACINVSGSPPEARLRY